MARTRASVAAKFSARKSSKARCSAATQPISSTPGYSERGSRGYSGGNPVCQRETPSWQKKITNFFTTKESDTDVSLSDDGDAAATSKPKPKWNTIHSDEECSPEKPKNNELDETIDLEPLTGENSHKIDEYYSVVSEAKVIEKPNPVVMAESNIKVESVNDNKIINKSINSELVEDNNNKAAHITVSKGKGIGKKSIGKENISKRSISKRERDEPSVSENDRKRIKTD